MSDEAAARAEVRKEDETNPTQTPPKFEPSVLLVAVLGGVSKQQAATLPRVAEAYLSSVRGSVRALFVGEDKVCAKDVFYRKPGGWWHQKKYRTALDMYIQEFRPFYLREARTRAEAIIDAALTGAASKMADLVDSNDDQIALRAAKEVLTIGGVGAEHTAGERVTVVIRDSQWTPG